MSPASDAFDLDVVVAGLWQRLRDVILAEQRLEGFAFAPEAPEIGWSARLAALADDASARADLARDVALRVLGAAADGVNCRLLSVLRQDTPVALDELARRLGLPPVAVAERLSALSQLGLAARDLERNGALGTAAGCGIVALIEALSERLGGRLGRELPALLVAREGQR